MIDSPETWREGATAYRNSIELAKEYRNDAIRRANEAFDRRAAAAGPVATASAAPDEDLGAPRAGFATAEAIGDVVTANTLSSRTSASEADASRTDSRRETPPSQSLAAGEPQASTSSVAEDEDESRPEPPTMMAPPAKRASKPTGGAGAQRKRPNNKRGG